MKNSSKWWLAAVLAVGAVGCAQFAGIATLRGADAATPDAAPADKAYAGRRPGTEGQALIARSYREQPPLIPHAVDNFDEITVTDNQCLDCHSPSAAKAKKAPIVAQGHLMLENGRPVLRMDRYQCNTCHVPQVDARPLVDSTFVGTPARR
ncbi:MAG: nitrate reductase cytochrome c-type subunit [Aquabacterium sp.]